MSHKGSGTCARAGGAPAAARLLVPMLGICAFRLSAWSVFGGSYLDEAGGAFAYSRLAQFAGIVAIALVSLRADIGARAWRGTVLATTCAMALSALLCLGRGPQDSLFVAARLLHGTCSAVLIMGWGAFTCGIEPRRSAPCVACAFALYGVASFALHGAGEAVADAVAVLAPLVSGGLLAVAPRVERACDAEDFATAEDARPAPARPARTVIARARLNRAALQGVNWGAAVLLLACCAVCSVSDILVTPGLTGTSTYTANVFRVFAFLLIAAVFCAWVLAARRDDPDQLWPLFSCTVFFGLLGYSSFSFVDEEASVSFMRATQDCIMLFAWVFVTGTCYRQELPALVTFGLGTVLFMRTDLVASILAPLGLLPGADAPSDGSLSVALSFAMAAVLIVYTIALLWRSAARAGGSADASATANRADGAAGPEPGENRPGAGDGDAAANALPGIAPFGLTAREEQVVGLLLRGYTLPQVGEHFGVSLNTARYYAKAIYRKMGIHSKAELIELAGGGERSGEKGR